MRVVQPKLQAVDGVQTAEIARRTRISRCAPGSIRRSSAAYGLTAADVSAALAANDYISGLGNTKGQMVQVNLDASTSLHSLDEFRNLVIKQVERRDRAAGGCRQRHARRRRLRNAGRLRRQAGGLYRHPGGAHPPICSTCIEGRAARSFPTSQASCPQGLDGEIIYDSTEFVNSSINEVITHAGRGAADRDAGGVRSSWARCARSLIPVVAIPLSLIGTFIDDAGRSASRSIC